MIVDTGNYAGDGGGARNITTTNDPNLVIIYTSGSSPLFRTSDMPANESAYLQHNSANVTSGITALGVNQFTVATGWNTSSTTYYWIAIQDDSNGDFATGTYSGAGGQSITTLGWQPCYVHVKRDGASYGCQKFEEQTGNNSFLLNTSSYDITDGITSFDVGGFTVGSNAATDQSSETYYWFAFKAIDGAIESHTFTGAVGDDRDITFNGTAFTPVCVILRVDAAGYPVGRWGGHATDLSWRMWSLGSTADYIQALNADGFQVGDNDNVNEASKTVYYLAFKDNTATGNTGPRGTMNLMRLNNVA